MLRRSVCCLLLALACVLVASPTPAPGQELKKVSEGRSDFHDSAAYRGSAGLRTKLASAALNYDPKDKAHKEAVAVMASEFVYPIYWDGVESFSPGHMNKLVEALPIRLGYLSREKNRDKTVALQQQLCRDVIDRCQEITREADKSAKSKAIVGLNAALMLSRIPERLRGGTGLQSEKDWADDVLPRLGDGVGDHLVNTCVDMLESEKAKQGKKDGPNDGARYYLFRTIASALSVPPPKNKAVIKKETAEKAVLAALDFVKNPPKFVKSTPPEEIQGYKALRREAVKVIAAGRTAEVGDKGHPALVLAKFAVNDESFKALEPRLDERTEAAIGLCRLVAAAADSPDLKTDYAAWCVAKAVHAFAQAANANLDDSGLKRKRPWKVEASLLLEGVAKMKGDGKNTYVLEAVKQCTDVLAALENNKKAEAQVLGGWLTDRPPESKAISKDETAVVKPVETKDE